MRHGPDEGASPIPARMMRQGQLAFDLVYTPERTPFLEAAERAGAATLGGLARPVVARRVLVVLFVHRVVFVDEA